MSNNKIDDIDLELLRDNFVSIEYFNLQQKLKQFLIECKKDSDDLLVRIDKILPKIEGRSFQKKEQMINVLKKYRLYIFVINGQVQNLYEDIEKLRNDEPIIKPTKAKGYLFEPIADIKPKKRNPPAIKKPKKPKDLTE